MLFVKIVMTVFLTSLYCISPLDVVPDVIPLLGWADDVGVVAFAAKLIGQMREHARVAG